MTKIKQRRQAERVGIVPTLSVAVAGGVALQMHNQPTGDVGEDYANHEGNTLIEGFLGFSRSLIRQAISHLSFRSETGAYMFPDIFYNYLRRKPTCRC